MDETVSNEFDLTIDPDLKTRGRKPEDEQSPSFSANKDKKIITLIESNVSQVAVPGKAYPLLNETAVRKKVS